MKKIDHLNTSNDDINQQFKSTTTLPEIAPQDNNIASTMSKPSRGSKIMTASQATGEHLNFEPKTIVRKPLNLNKYGF